MRTLLRALVVLAMAIGIGIGIYAIIQPINATASLSSGENPRSKGGSSTGGADAISAAAAPWPANSASTESGIAHRIVRPRGGGGIVTVMLVLGKFMAAFGCVAVLRSAARKIVRRKLAVSGSRRGASSP